MAPSLFKKKLRKNTTAPGIKFKIAAHDANPVTQGGAPIPLTSEQILMQVWKPSEKKTKDSIKYKG